MPEVREIGETETLTQAGERKAGGFSFPHSLQDGQPDVSLTAGELSAADACFLWHMGLGKRSEKSMRGDVARRATAGRLRELRFRVEHTPDLANPDHVSAYWDHGEWDAKVADLFCRAFTSTVTRPEGDSDG